MEYSPVGLQPLLLLLLSVAGADAVAVAVVGAVAAVCHCVLERAEDANEATVALRKAADWEGSLRTTRTEKNCGIDTSRVNAAHNTIFFMAFALVAENLPRIGLRTARKSDAMQTDVEVEYALHRTVLYCVLYNAWDWEAKHSRKIMIIIMKMRAVGLEISEQLETRRKRVAGVNETEQ